MEQVKRSRRLMHPCTQRHLIQDVPQELIQYIQSLLPVKEAARTSVLSKSWLHAWSTVPTLRFLQSVHVLSEQQKANYIKLIDAILTRYLRDNIPITTFHLNFGIENKESSCLAENWIRPVASKSCLKELYLTIWFRISLPFTMPDEIFSGENLDKLSVTDQGFRSCSIFIGNNPMINCVNLRVLELINVHISQEFLDNLFSTCNLLRKVKLLLPEGVMMTAKV
uniref:putative F-box/LRR-repeat protein At5g41840 n=1 Tax=Erigeron canadensis TaxID=72917 RepID=UPI001CB8C25D|nr:putative F-box/LRR-repeat protein At5g41840 [Erigeron canadensis]